MAWQKRDPIGLFKSYLLSSSILDEAEISSIEKDAECTVRTEAERAVRDMADTLSIEELERLSSVRFPHFHPKTPQLHIGTFRQAIYEALDEILEENGRAFLIGEDIGAYGGCFGVTGDLYRKHPDQVLETPVAEEAFSGMAAGAAAMGELPIVELMYGDFSTLASDALINHAAKLHYMSAGQLSCPMILRTPMGGGTGHGAQHTQSLENMFRVPGLIAVAPSDALSAKALLKSAALSKDPVVFIEHKKLYSEEGAIGDDGVFLPLGKAIVEGDGNDMLVIGYSHAFSLARKALSDFSDKITFIDLATIHPLDEETIKKEYMRVGKALIVQDTPLECSVAESVIRIIADTGMAMNVRTVSALSMPLAVSRRLESAALPSLERIREEAFLLGLR